MKPCSTLFKYLFIFVSAILSGASYAGSPVQKAAGQTPDIAEVRALINRVTHEKSSAFILEAIPERPGVDSFYMANQAGKVFIRATSTRAGAGAGGAGRGGGGRGAGAGGAAGAGI